MIDTSKQSVNRVGVAKSEAKVPEAAVWWKHLLAGAVAGGTAKTITAPIDRLKIFAQVYHTENFSIRAGMKELFATGGLRSFWRGNGINVIKIIPETSTKFLVYEEVKRWLKKGTDEPITLHERFIAGAAAGSASQTFIYPMDVIKTKLALRRTARPLKMGQVAVSAYKKYGFKWFYRGYFTNLAGVLIFASIDMPLYETLKMQYKSYYEDKQKVPVYALLCCGFISSITGQLASYPLAMITTSIQSRHQWKKMHPMTLMVTIVKEKIAQNGLRGLYRGIVPAMLKAVPSTCVSYAVYESVLRFLGTEMT